MTPDKNIVLALILIGSLLRGGPIVPQERGPVEPGDRVRVTASECGLQQQAGTITSLEADGFTLIVDGEDIRCPTMGQAVKTYLIHTPAADGVTASVRSFRKPGSSAGAWWGGVGCRFSARRPGDLPALAFSAGRREPSYYLGLCGPLLRSVHQGGIAYPGGLRPVGPAQQKNGCSPLYRSRLRIPWVLDVSSALRAPLVGPDPR